jgi:purine nucleosidase
MPRHLLIDTDTASDDAVALIMANHYPGVHIQAITTIAGNVPVEQATQNALYIQELLGKKEVPVFEGAAKPILRPLETAQFFHGHDGLGDVGLPLSGRIPEAGHAVTAILRAVDQFPGELELVTLGPLTNVAIAILQAPDLANRVKHCVVMGGVGQGPGNITSLAEFNFWVDPEAAKIVFESGMPITMVGWDVAWKYTHFNEADAEVLLALDTPLAQFAVDIQKASMDYVEAQGKERAFNLPDPAAMAVVLDPAVVTEKIYRPVEVLCHDDDSRGMTVVDHREDIKPTVGSVEVVLGISHSRFLEMLKGALG